MHRPTKSILTIILACLLGSPVAGDIIGGAFNPVGSDIVARFFHNATRLSNGQVMVTGGTSIQPSPISLITLDHASFFDPGSGTFTSLYAPGNGGPATDPTLMTPRSDHTQTMLLDGRVLLTGGFTGASGRSPGVYTDTVEIFDPQTGQFTTGPPMSSPRASHTASALSDGRVLVAGGSGFEVFDATTDSWSPPYVNVHLRTAHAAVVLGDDSVLLLGGSGSGSNTIERLNANTGNSQLLASTFGVGVDDLAAVLLDDGLVLIVGGQELRTGNTIATSYLLDPVADTIVTIPDPPDLAGGIADHQMLKMGGVVMVLGGEQQNAGTDLELDVVRLYNAARNTWTLQLTMASAHDDAPAVLLDDGRLLVIGGGVQFFGQEFPSALAEVFVPGTAGAGDVDCNGVVNVDDLVLVILHWGACPLMPTDCPGDADQNDTVDVDDLVLVILNWG